MKVYDISWPIFGAMTSYKNKNLVQLNMKKNLEHDGVRESVITMSSHTGTHIDAPAHFLKYGKSIEEIDPLACVGPAHVVDLTHVVDEIKIEHLEGFDVQKGAIILLKTKNSKLEVNAPFNHNFVYVGASAARWLAEKEIRAVGIDYLGIERKQPNHETHKAFMEKNIPIVEGLRLDHVDQGSYFMWCLPLCIPGIDAVPARAILIQKTDND